MWRYICSLLLVVFVCACAYNVEQHVGLRDADFRKPVQTEKSDEVEARAILSAIERKISRDLKSPEVAFERMPKVTIVLKSPTLALIADLIEKQTGWRIVYPRDLAPSSLPPITCKKCGFDEVIEHAAKVLDLYPHVDRVRRKVELRKYVTKTFIVPILDSKLESETELSIESSSSSSNTGWEMSTPQADVSVKEKLEAYSVWDEVVRTVRGMVKGNGTVSASRRLSVITVTARPSVMEKVEEYLNGIIEMLSVQVEFDVVVYEVSLKAGYERGVEWSKIFTSYPHVFTLTGGGTLEAPFAILRLTSERSTNSFLIQLLSEYGDVYVVSQPHIFLQNGYTTFFSSGNVVPFVRTVRREYYGDISQESIIPEMSQTHEGIVFTLSCRVLPGRRVLVSIAPILTTISGWRDFQFPGISFSNPEITRKQFVTRAIIHDGATLIIGGIQIRERRRSGKTPAIPGIGAVLSKKGHSAGKSELVIAITPHIVKTAAF